MNVMTKIRPAKTAGITSEIVTITPEMAKTWLELNINNRRARDRGIARYAADIKSGAWMLTGDAIRFSVAGKLLDGQNRLKACVKADCSFQTFVMYGFPDETQDVMDNGINRSVIDTLTTRGISNSARVGPSLRALLYYKSGATAFSSHAITKSQVISTLERHPNITKSVGQLAGLPPRSPLAVIGFVNYAATYLMDKADEAGQMLAVLKSGVPAYAGDTIHAFREKIIRVDDMKYKQEYVTWTLFNCFNLFCKGTPLRVVRIVKTPVDIIGLDRKKL